MAAFHDYERTTPSGSRISSAAGRSRPRELLDAAIERVEARNPTINAVVMPLYDYGRKAIADGLARRAVSRRAVSPEGPHRLARRGEDDARLALLRRHAAGRRRQRARGAAQARRPGRSSAGPTRASSGSRSPASRSSMARPGTRGIRPASPAARAAARPRRWARGCCPWRTRATGSGRSGRPRPAAGSSGLKPTRARNTMAPYTGEGLGGLSTEHAVTLSVRDSAALLDATAGPGAGDPYAAPPPARPFLEEVGADRPARSGSRTRRPRPTARPSTPVPARARPRDAALCADLGHHVEEADPEIDRAAVVPTFLTLAAANTVVNLGSHPTAGRPPRRGRGRARHVGHGAAGRAHHRAGLRARHPGRPSAGPPDGRIPPALPRPAHAGARHAGRRQARVDRHDARGRG